MKVLSICSIFLCWLFPYSILAADDDYKAGIPLNKEPLHVRMGFTLSNITDVNEREETIDFDGAFFLILKDGRLAYDPPLAGYTVDYKSGDY
jgi:hypothetical protein